MNKDLYKSLLEAEVFLNNKNPFVRIYNKYINPSTNAVFMFRKMQYFNSKNNVFYHLIRDLLKKRLNNKYGIVASPSAIIGKNLRLPHPTSIVIGAHVVAGENLSVYQNTTLGGARLGDVKKGNQPTLGDNVTVFANSLVLGKINIGNDVIVGANSLVLESMPDGAICVGSPAKNKNIKEK